MPTNFQFLQSEFKTVFNWATKAEKNVLTDPRTSLIYARMALETGVKYMFVNDKSLEEPTPASLHNLMTDPDFKRTVNYKLQNELFSIKKAGNLATHSRPVNKMDSRLAIESLFYFAKWLAMSYCFEPLGEIGVFNPDDIPKEASDQLNKRELEKLRRENKDQLEDFQEQLQSEKEKREKLASENDLYKKQLEDRQSKLAKQKEEANTADENEHPRNERETRKYLIDVALREAGWDLQGKNDKEYKVTGMPKSTNPSGTGYVDYVLWGDDGLPLALVEAKQTMVNATRGENQAQLYADAIEEMHGQRPVMYYSNGYDTFLWDDQFYKQARQVHGFYTKEELQRVIWRRTNRKDIRKEEIDTDIVERYYHWRAIRSIAEHFSANDRKTGKLIGTHRGALLVLATGTGKTRTSIAFSKLLFKANWAKRILFLADRTSLVKQAQRNFVKLLPDHASVNLLKDKDNPDARIAFSTYQTMINLIDGEQNEDGRLYGVGHFDMIIIDEAHRSIYQKYQTIFEYFDALLLGLTATPKHSIDKNTFNVFGLDNQSPTDAYSFEEAVEDNYLKPYNTVELPTKFLTSGIVYDELSEEEKKEFENEILNGEAATGNERIPSSELDKWLFNESTALKTLQFILKNGIKKRGGEELGKTIVFAKNQKHAHFLKDMFLKLDKSHFGNDYVKVITHNQPKSQVFIERFCDEDKERLPQIAISVDMMDTGIDAPSCVNLVFYKPVKSYTKFWQMIGRGSRLRPDLFGKGKDKEKFLIFDLLGNFEFFRENRKGIETSIQKSLSEVVFNLRLELAQYLKSTKFSDNENLQNFKSELLNGLHNDITDLDRNRFDVNMKLETVDKYKQRETWNHLTKFDCRKIEEELAPLVKPQKGDADTARFYDRLLYKLIKKRLETPNTEEFIGTFAIPIGKVTTTSKKLLSKTSIPVIKTQVPLIESSLDNKFWENQGIAHLEELRKNIRNLVQYIDPEDQRYVTTNFQDKILEDQIKTNTFTGEGPIGYSSQTFKNNIQRVEKLIRENKDNISISRIRRGEKITKEELRSLEDILFSEVDKKQLEQELDTKIDLVDFILSLLGLSRESVDKAFADFSNNHQLSAIQIEFLNTIKQFLTTNGTIEPEKLYESPFKTFHTQGIDGVFSDEEADKILDIVKGFEQVN